MSRKDKEAHKKNQQQEGVEPKAQSGRWVISIVFVVVAGLALLVVLPRSNGSAPDAQFTIQYKKDDLLNLEGILPFPVTFSSNFRNADTYLWTIEGLENDFYFESNESNFTTDFIETGRYRVELLVSGEKGKENKRSKEFNLSLSDQYKSELEQTFSEKLRAVVDPSRSPAERRKTQSEVRDLLSDPEMTIEIKDPNSGDVRRHPVDDGLFDLIRDFGTPQLEFDKAGRISLAKIEARLTENKKDRIANVHLPPVTRSTPTLTPSSPVRPAPRNNPSQEEQRVNHPSEADQPSAEISSQPPERPAVRPVMEKDVLQKSINGLSNILYNDSPSKAETAIEQLVALLGNAEVKILRKGRIHPIPLPVDLKTYLRSNAMNYPDRSIVLQDFQYDQQTGAITSIVIKE